MNTATQTSPEILERMFTAGVHYGLSKARRHPSNVPYLFGQKQRIDIFDLEKTSVLLERAKEFARLLGREGKHILFLGGKPESQNIVKQAAIRVGAPYCIGRWIGGSFTNLPEITKRVSRLTQLIEDKKTGALEKYTKFERLQIDREIEKLEGMYAGLVTLAGKLPHALFVVDPKREAIAVKEAKQLGIPVIALANSDCDSTDIEYAVPANDTSLKSISFIVEQIAQAYEEGGEEKPLVAAVSDTSVGTDRV